MTPAYAHGRESHRLPPSAGRALIGKLFSVTRDRLGLMTALARDLGDASRFRLGHRDLYFFNHPDHAKHVLLDNAGNYRKGIGLAQARRVLGDGLLTSEGPVWAAQRRTLSAVLQQHHGSRFAAVVMRQIRAALGHWPIDEPVDLAAAMSRLTVDVLESTLVGADLGPKDALIAALSAVQEQAMFEMVTLGVIPHWLPLPRLRRYYRAQAHIERLVSRLLADRDRSGQMGSAVPGMSRDELVTLLLTGHETTASVLAWTLYLLSHHPGVADRVAAEADAVLGSPGVWDRIPAPSAPDALPFATAVIRETIRLYPPVWLLPRRSLAEDRISGYRVPAGTDVLICPYTLHRHDGFWERPEVFAPSRFARGRRASGDRCAYLPFGVGPRACPGSQFGLAEAVIVTALVARERRLFPVAGAPIGGAPMLTLRPDGAVPVVAPRR